MTLAADALEPVMLRHVEGQPIQTLVHEASCRRELRASRQENHDVHGGGTPDVLRPAGVGPSPVPPEVLQLRRAIDELLAKAEAAFPD